MEATPAAVVLPPLGAWIMGAGRKYVTIFAWLAVLTVIEIVATRLSFSRKELAAFLIGTSLLKANLVALYFMHLRHEVRIVLAMIAVALVIALAFMIGIFPDTVLGARGR